MRTLLRNTRPLTYRNLLGTEEILDSAGNTTLEYRAVFSEPVTVRMNISAAVGNEAVEAFGNMTDYSRTISLCGECPFNEGSRIEFDGKDYVVVKVADSKNGFLVAIREVAADA